MKYLLTLLLFVSIFSHAEKVLYCQTELGTGIGLNNKRYITSNIDNQRLTIKFNDDFSKLAGLGVKEYVCDKNFPHTSETLTCLSTEFMGDSFTYNPKNNRFYYVVLTPGGYIEPYSSDTPALFAGTCQNF